MYHLHRNKKEWRSPNEYIPERFDPESEWYLRPDGGKRHPMSFGPFLGGKRICLGKTFVETMSKIISPTILYNFDFSFADEKSMEKKPENNTTSLYEPEIMVNITSRFQ